eukprot:CAMPEP_0198216014 /NCGR_PEP_ID=MMETSP1445-20131203/54232_1 /TAXON_ID=36898 /ORGANISM="Pyramimonas sp., Strain CCMP2087" /LENGTH=78 /DNA_ID=CAMNT_0043892027 /DNA_START=105 /DNA_END=341 /DNA_ORIENTATION=-
MHVHMPSVDNDDNRSGSSRAARWLAMLLDGPKLLPSVGDDNDNHISSSPVARWLMMLLDMRVDEEDHRMGGQWRKMQR